MFKNRRKFGIKGKIILPLLIIIVSGITLILVTILSFFTATTNNLSNDMMLEIGEHYENLIGRDIDTHIATARLLVPIMQQVASENMSREDALILLKDILANDSSIAGIYTCWEPTFFEGKEIDEDNMHGFNSKGSFAPYITKGGTGQIKIETNESYETQYYYILPKTTKKEAIMDPYFTHISSKPTFVSSIVEPIFLDGTFVGVVGIDILLDSISDTLKDVTLYDNGNVFVVSNTGIIISHPNEELIYTSLFNYVSSEEKNKILNSLEDNKIMQFSTTNSISNNTLDSDSTEKNTKIKDYLKENKIMQLDTINSITNISYENKIIPLRIGDTGISWGVGVSVPVYEVNAPIRKGLYIGIGISLIVYALATVILLFLTEGLKKRIYNIVNKLSKSSSFVLSASTQLTGTSQELADGTNEQAASIEETSASMEETSSMVKQNAENSKTASSLSIEAKESANIGSKKMNILAESMKKLEESSNQISKIIDVIDDIAFQTNILALNAAIEAARAGDAGKGFGVVAEEVRSLAQKSADAAKDTSKLLESNIELTNISSNESEDVKESLDIITSKVENAVSLIAEVSAASDEQSKGVEQITNAINSMEQVVQNNAASAEESAAAAEELQAQSNELESVINDLVLIVKGNKKEKESKSKKKKKSIFRKEKVLKSEEESTLALDENVKNQKLETTNTDNNTAGKKKHIISPEEIIPLDEDNEF